MQQVKKQEQVEQDTKRDCHGELQTSQAASNAWKCSDRRANSLEGAVIAASTKCGTAKLQLEVLLGIH